MKPRVRRSFADFSVADAVRSRLHITVVVTERRRATLATERIDDFRAG